MTACSSFDSSAPAQVASVIVTLSPDTGTAGASVAASVAASVEPGASVAAGSSVAPGASVAGGACVSFGPHAAKSMPANITRIKILRSIDIFSLLTLFDRLNSSLPVHNIMGESHHL